MFPVVKASFNSNSTALDKFGGGEFLRPEIFGAPRGWLTRHSAIETSAASDLRCRFAADRRRRTWVRPTRIQAQVLWRRMHAPSRGASVATQLHAFSQSPRRSVSPPRSRGAFVPRIRVDRVDTLAGLYRTLPVVSASALIASATELMGRVVRDQDLVAAVRDASRPTASDSGGRARIVNDHPAVWGASVVALGLLGVTPTADDWAVAKTASEYDCVAVLLAATLASPGDALACVTRLGAGLGRTASVAARRLEIGRLMTVVG